MEIQGGRINMDKRLGAQMFEQAMRTAISDHFKPTRYEVVEKN